MKRILLATFVIFAACPLPVIKPTPDGFTIEPQSASASPGSVVRLMASVALGAPPVTWTATGGGVVAADGTFTAPGCASALPATITITATSGTFSSTSTISVADKITSVTVSPPTVTLAPGATQLFTATVRSVCFPGGMTQNLKLKKAQDGSLAVLK